MRHLFQACLGLFLIAFIQPALAHEVRPAYLQLKQIENSKPANPLNKTFDVIWKQPLLNDKRLRINPILPEQCHVISRSVDKIIPGALIQNWQVDCEDSAFQQQPLVIQGLSSTLTDVLVNVEQLNGKSISTLLRPSQPELWLHQNTNLNGYFLLGIKHLLSGFDHLLFILGLMFFVQGFSSLIKTITAFTAAHSITLAASVLGWVSLPQTAVEAAIALSILFLAVEASSPHRQQTLTARLPWLVAFIFGLLHGFGFASTLSDIGLPEEATAQALLLFNLGVEAGQILVISIVLSLLYVFTRWTKDIPLWLEQTPVYMVGTISSYWLFQRLAVIIGT